jgi:hypothetical protein
MHLFPRTVAAAAALLGFCSCSMKISHPDGSVTYLGAVNLREGSAGDSLLVHSRRYGVMLDANSSSSGVALGYDDRLFVKPPCDAVTSINYEPGSDPEVSIRSSR